MNPNFRWLVWKEARQLIPLLITLVAIVGILWTIQSSMWSVRTDTYYSQLEWTFLILPIVFATGAGAVLVGFEREQRTMQWMSMLPMTSRRLILTKALVAFIGLALVWIPTAGLLYWFGVDRSLGSRLQLDDASVQLDGVHLLVWVVRSIFILIVSFFTAWRIRNPFLSLVILVALMFVPSLIVWTLLGGPAVEIWIGQSREVWLTLAAMGISTIGFAWAGYRGAIRELSPAKVRTWQLTDALRWIGETFSGRRAYAFENSFAALLWQSLRSMAWVWMINLGLIGFVVLSCLSFTRPGIASLNQSPSFLAMLAGVAVSWLGVSAFKFAGSPTSVLPLALMGVSPTRVYLARHAVPVSILSAGIVAYTFVATWMLKTPATYPDNQLDWLPSVLAVCVAAGWVYAISQWISQCLRTTVLAYLAAPLLSLSIITLMFGRNASAMGSTGWSFVWIVALLLVTWWLMRRYMMGIDRTHSVAISAVILVAFYFGIVRVRSVRPDGVQDVQLVGLKGIDAPGADSPPIEIISVMPNWYERMAQPESEKLPELSEAIRSKLDDDYPRSMSLFENVTALRASPDSVASMTPYTFGQLFNALMFERMVFRVDRDERFYETLGDVAKIVAGLRRSDRWIDQEFADRLEVYLADTWSDEALGLDRSNVHWIEARHVLPTIASRNESRKRAIAMSYREYQSKPTVDGDTSIGGMSLKMRKQSMSSIESDSGPRDRMTTIVRAALDAIDRESVPGKIQPWQVTMHEQLVFAAVPLDWGPYSDWHRNQLPTIVTIAPGYFEESMYPIRYVGLAWEEQIEVIRNAAVSDKGKQ